MPIATDIVCLPPCRTHAWSREAIKRCTLVSRWPKIPRWMDGQAAGSVQMVRSQPGGMHDVAITWACRSCRALSCVDGVRMA